MIRDSIKPDLTMLVSYSILENQNKYIVEVNVQSESTKYILNKSYINH